MNALQTQQAKKAERELAKMKGSLADWLKYRDLNISAGVVVPNRRQKELPLQQQLHTLLVEMYGAEAIPEGADAAQLASMVLHGPSASGPEAQGFVPLLIIAGGVALVLMFSIGTYASRLSEQEKLAACKAGVVTDVCPKDNLVKYLLIGGAAWFIWTQTNIFSKWKKA